MAINFRLGERREHDVMDDPMGRTWVGWDPTSTDEVLWAHNRGRYNLGPRADEEELATLSYGGVIHVVARVTGPREEVAHPSRGVTKHAMVGEILLDGDPVRDALVGRRVPPGRNPVSYVDTSDVDEMPPGELGRPITRSPEAFLLTWNPDRWTMEPAEWDGYVRSTTRGAAVRSRWSTGNRKSGIEPGDRAWLLRQGRQERGLVASGTFRSRVFVDEHWSDDGTDANYCLVDWDTALPLDDALSTALLQDRLPSQHWEPESSGTSVRTEVAKELERAWSQHTGHPTPPPPAGRRQGWQMDPVRRKKVEDAAQNRLMQHYRDLRWTVRDTRTISPYDAVAQKGGEVLYLEAKGTETAGVALRVTHGEVKHARLHRGKCVLGVLSDVRFDANGDVDPASGVFRIYDWDAADTDLEPTDYLWTPSSKPHFKA